MIANSSAWLPPSGLGRLPNTPTTVYCVRPMRTCLPIGSAAGNSAWPGALPSTTTLRRRSTSAWVKTRPASSGIELVWPKLALAPITPIRLVALLP